MDAQTAERGLMMGGGGRKLATLRVQACLHAAFADVSNLL